VTLDDAGMLGPRNADGSLPQVNFLRPASVSHLVDAGVDVGLPYAGTAPDIGPFEFVPSLLLQGIPADQAIYLNWTVNTTLPVTTTWQISYDGPAGTQPSPITGLPESTRTYTLTGLTNYTPYNVTLEAMSNSTTIFTDTITVMPTDLLGYLPLIRK
jgi:hypothetical protein